MSTMSKAGMSSDNDNLGRVAEHRPHLHIEKTPNHLQRDDTTDNPIQCEQNGAK